MKNKYFEYQVTMSIVRNLLEKGLITGKEYCEFNDMMIAKYTPKTIDLFSNIDLK